MAENPSPAPAGEHFAEVVVDVAAVRANAAALRERVAPAALMAVVKADAYGHGLLPCARAALEGGATWLGVAQPAEALALRAAGIEAPLLTWLYPPGGDLEPLVRARVDVSVSSQWALEEVVAAARAAGATARVHLKADTGLCRGGASRQEWPDLVRASAKHAAEGAVHVVGVWSHLASSDVPADAANAEQVAAFEEALGVAAAHGVEPEVRHLANSAATLTNPASHYDLVRCGLALYGLTPVPDLAAPADLGLVPAMTLSAFLALVKRVPAGSRVSYGGTYTTRTDTTLGLVPLGYADGVPRSASGSGPVLVAGRRRNVAGRVCMDQFVVDLGSGPDAVAAAAGDRAVLFGPGAAAGRPQEPTAQDWAEAAGTISYEIVSRLGARVPRRWTGERA
ncbi:alanine racemase [Kineococcus xinjiangensis]|uniref:Alanine racemase n=1 Tax=Kineococcus xinjiangensis TaxID=512762 RepID=A0A2S6ITN0_9ACTN|nr:alanine racemase [Kineococcus xinjiangensis]PPK97578.1 alanine racemase [Kineococcus xinjiangensis]